MNYSMFTHAGFVLILLAVPLARGGEVDVAPESDCAHHHGPDAFGCSLAGHWLDPWPHSHFSPGGAPYIHNFGFEPAFLGRDLLATYGWAELEEGDEQELEFELEWALTRRIGFVIEQAYVWEDPDGESSVDGYGDLAIVPRFVLCEQDRFLLSANLEIEAPTGSDELGAGEEWHLAPFLTTWMDLGDWWALTSATGFEFALDSNETEFFLGVGLAKSFRLADPASPVGSHGGQGGAHHHHGHELPGGILSLIAELYGETVIDGDEDEEGRWIFEALVGASYSLFPGFDIRAGYAFALSGDSELDGALRLGAICHF